MSQLLIFKTTLRGLFFYNITVYTGRWRLRGKDIIPRRLVSHPLCVLDKKYNSEWLVRISRN